MEGCHVIIFISQNPNPNFLLSFHHHGSRRRHLRQPPWKLSFRQPRTAPSRNLLRSHRSSTLRRNLHHFRSAHEPPSRLRLLRTSISRRNPTTTIPQHHHRSCASRRSSVTTAPATNLQHFVGTNSHAPAATASTPPLHLQRVAHQRRLLRNHPLRSRNCSAPPQHHRSHVPRSSNHHAGNLTAAPSAAPSRGREESVRVKP